MDFVFWLLKDNGQLFLSRLDSLEADTSRYRSIRYKRFFNIHAGFIILVCHHKPYSTIPLPLYYITSLLECIEHHWNSMGDQHVETSKCGYRDHVKYITSHLSKFSCIIFVGKIWKKKE